MTVKFSIILTDCRTFVPTPLVDMKNAREDQISGESFEDLRTTEEKINTWTATSGKYNILSKICNLTPIVTLNTFST